ncbi:MAG TPA: DUF5706 domain-containing protein [Saprospiraceae bacterium]|nr:DUF5706 domain-containing protein [Saprospiraceae bacterium]HNT21916.1 DUF5706 domain-containing protein [Saprospiraceae bacterium]
MSKPDINPEDTNILTAYDESFVPWAIYGNLQSSIQFADNKINLLFVIAGIILSIVLESIGDFSEESLVFKIVFVLLLLIMIPFLYYSIRTVAAHTIHRPDVQTRKLYFFGDILRMPASQFIEHFKSNTRTEHYDELLLQVHNLSHIAKKKFENYSKALYLLSIMMGLLIVLLVSKAFL